MAKSTMYSHSSRRGSGSMLIIVTLLAIVMSSLAASLLLAVQAEKTSNDVFSGMELSKEASLSGLGLRLLQYNDGDATSDSLVYTFQDGSQATVLMSATGDDIILESRGLAQGIEHTVWALLGPGAEESGGGHLGFSANNFLELRNYAVVHDSFDSDTQLPSETTSDPSNVRSNGTVDIRMGSNLSGDVVSVGNVTIADGVTVTGTITSPSLINNGGSYGAYVQDNPAAVSYDSNNSLIDTTYDYALSHVTIDHGSVTVGGTLILASGSIHKFDDLTIESFATLAVQTPATILITNTLNLYNDGILSVLNADHLDLIINAGLELSNDSMFSFEDADSDSYGDASVTIYSKGLVSFQNGGHQGPNPPRPPTFVIYMKDGQLLEFRNDASFYGVISNPFGEVAFRNSTAFYGSGVGWDVTTGNYVSFKYDQATAGIAGIGAGPGSAGFEIAAISDETP